MKTGDTIKYEIINQGDIHIDQVYVYKPSANILLVVVETKEADPGIDAIGCSEKGPVILFVSDDEMVKEEMVTHIRLDLPGWDIFNIGYIGSRNTGVSLIKND